VLESGDGKEWRSAAELKSDRGDLRDPKVLVTPDGRLMLIAAVALHPRGAVTHQTLVWFSDDGRDWGEPADIGEPNVWLWRVAWAGKTAYGAGYSVGAERFVRWYESADGRNFRTVVPRFDVDGYANETALVFKPDGEAVCLLRRDGQGAGATAQLGIAAPPYRSWKWTDLGVQIGGPAMIRLPDGRFIAAVRFYDGGARTSLAWVDVERGGLREVLRLPSGGDTSYAGLVWHEDSLWISYYSSHEGKSAIYFARARLGE
jgi:hypothetical protein